MRDENDDEEDEDDDEDQGNNLTAADDAMITESDAPTPRIDYPETPPKACGCSIDVTDEWLEAIDADITFGFEKALGFLEESRDFDQQHTRVGQKQLVIGNHQAEMNFS